MGVLRMDLLIVLVMLLCASLAPLGLGDRMEATEDVLLSQLVNPLSGEMDQDMVELLWTGCGHDLVNMKDAVDTIDLGFLQRIFRNIDAENTGSRSLAKENMQKLISTMHPQLKQSLLNCLRRRDNLLLPESGKDVASENWYTRYLKPLFPKPDVPRRQLGNELIQHTLRVSAPTSPPPTSPPSSSGKNTVDPTSPPSSSSKNTVEPISPPGSSGNNTVVIAVAVTASVTFLIAAVLFCFCYKYCFGRGKAEMNDDRPLLSLSSSEHYVGSSHKSHQQEFRNSSHRSDRLSTSGNTGAPLAPPPGRPPLPPLRPPPGKVNPLPHERPAALKPLPGRSSHPPLPPGLSGPSPPPPRQSGPPAPPPPARSGPPPPPPPARSGPPAPPPPARSGPPPPPPPARSGPPAPPPPARSGPPPPPPPARSGPPPPPPPQKSSAAIAGNISPGAPPPPPGPRVGPLVPPPMGAPRPPQSGRPPLGQKHSSSSGEVMLEGRTKLKPFFWDKVQANPDHSMVWHQLKAGSFQFNEEMIETLFGSAPVDKNKNVAKKAQDPANQFVKIIDSKKAQNLAILLRALNVTTEEVCDALTEGNELPPELLHTLLKMAPTTEEELKLRMFSGELSQLGPAERFLKALVCIPFAFKRFESLLFMGSFQEEVAAAKEAFATLEVASNELKKNRLFLKLLEAVLKTGNRMNDGTFRGGAQAFKLDTLLKLSDVKGKDGKTTLLHFVVQEIIRTEGIRAARAARESKSISSVKSDSEDLPEENDNDSEEHLRNLGLQVVSGLSNDLENVKRAAAIDADAFTGTVARLGHGVVKARNFLNSEMNNVEEDSGFHQSLKSFVQYAEGDVKLLLEEENRIMMLVKKTGDYFHGNSAKHEGLRLFSIVRDFLIMLDKACKDVKERPAKPPPRKEPPSAPPSSTTTTTQESPSPKVQAPAQTQQSPDVHQLFSAIKDRRVDSDSSDDEGP